MNIHKFTPSQQQEINQIIWSLKQFGGINVRVEEKGSSVLVVGDFDDGPRGMKKHGFVGFAWNGSEYKWTPYSSGERAN